MSAERQKRYRERQKQAQHRSEIALCEIEREHVALRKRIDHWTKRGETCLIRLHQAGSFESWDLIIKRPLGGRDHQYIGGIDRSLCRYLVQLGLLVKSDRDKIFGRDLFEYRSE